MDTVNQTSRKKYIPFALLLEPAKLFMIFIITGCDKTVSVSGILSSMALCDALNSVRSVRTASNEVRNAMIIMLARSCPLIFRGQTG